MSGVALCKQDSQMSFGFLCFKEGCFSGVSGVERTFSLEALSALTLFHPSEAVQLVVLHFLRPRCTTL